MTLCTYSKTWVTVDLDNRTAGACCRTPQHDINGEIDINDEWYQSLRTNLSNGIEDQRCNVCWQQDKLIGSSLRQQGPVLNSTILSTPEAELQYLEIRLGNQCDGACVYCGGEFSVKQAKFWQLHLDIPKPVIKEPLINETKKLIENNTKTLSTIVFIGGEPSMMERWYDFIDFISSLTFDNELSVVITTNANWTSKTRERLFLAIEKFLANTDKKFNIRVSGEGDEEYFRGVRKFSDYHRVLENIDYLAKQFGNRVSYTLQPVLNGLSIYSLESWLSAFTDLFKSNGIGKIWLHFALLTRPDEFQTVYQGKLAVPAIDSLINFIQASDLFYGKTNRIQVLESQKSILIDREPNIEKMAELANLLRAHDNILPNDWKSEDALSPIKHTL